MKKINEKDKTVDYDYNDIKFDIEENCKEQQQQEFEDEMGVYDLDDESFFQIPEDEGKETGRESDERVKDREMEKGRHRSKVKGNKVKGKGEGMLRMMDIEGKEKGGEEEGGDKYDGRNEGKESDGDYEEEKEEDGENDRGQDKRDGEENCGNDKESGESEGEEDESEEWCVEESEEESEDDRKRKEYIRKKKKNVKKKIRQIIMMSLLQYGKMENL
jgi:hypothetical protein